MKLNVCSPSLADFRLGELDAVTVAYDPAHIFLRTTVAAGQDSRPLCIALLSDNHEHGIAISVDPATGEVCDLINDGGVIDFLSSPVFAGQPLEFEVSLHKFGKNCVVNIHIQDESFLYPGFILDGQDAAHLTSFVGAMQSATGEVLCSRHELTISATEVPMVA